MSTGRKSAYNYLIRIYIPFFCIFSKHGNCISCILYRKRMCVRFNTIIHYCRMESCCVICHSNTLCLTLRYHSISTSGKYHNYWTVLTVQNIRFHIRHKSIFCRFFQQVKFLIKHNIHSVLIFVS